LGFGGPHPGDDFPDEGIDDRIDALGLLDLGAYDAVLLEDGKVLRNDRLRLLKASPQIRYAGIVLLGDEAEELQSDGMPYRLQLLGEIGDDFIVACLLWARHRRKNTLLRFFLQLLLY